MKEVADWVEQYRQRWEESFSGLDEYLVKMGQLEAEREAKGTNDDTVR